MPGIITPRTRSQYANFKKGADEKTRLENKRGDVRRITKPPTPTPRKGDKSPIYLFVLVNFCLFVLVNKIVCFS